MNVPHRLDRPASPEPSGNSEADDRSYPKAVERAGAHIDVSNSQSATRYTDQPVTWSTRLVGIAGVLGIVLAIVGGLLFTWQVYTAPPAAPTLSVFDAAPVEPPSETPPAPDQRETPRPTHDQPKIEPPKIELPATAPLLAPVAPAPLIEREATPERQPTPPPPPQSIAKPTWEGMVLAALNKAKRFPRAAQRSRQQGVPYIRFVMDREGQVQSVRLERSSGVRTLDEEALALPKRASPLPKPPEDVKGGSIELVVPVEFFLR